jgi:hypothetical protein
MEQNPNAVRDLLPPRACYTLHETMVATGWSRTRLFGAIAAGRIKSFKFGKLRFISAQALTAAIEQMERDTAARENLPPKQIPPGLATGKKRARA